MVNHISFNYIRLPSYYTLDWNYTPIMTRTPSKKMSPHQTRLKTHFIFCGVVFYNRTKPWTQSPKKVCCWVHVPERRFRTPFCESFLRRICVERSNISLVVELFNLCNSKSSSPSQPCAEARIICCVVVLYVCNIGVYLIVSARTRWSFTWQRVNYHWIMLSTRNEHTLCCNWVVCSATPIAYCIAFASNIPFYHLIRMVGGGMVWSSTGYSSYHVMVEKRQKIKLYMRHMQSPHSVFTVIIYITMYHIQPISYFHGIWHGTSFMDQHSSNPWLNT